MNARLQRTAADAGTHTASAGVLDAQQPMSFSDGLSSFSPRGGDELQLSEDGAPIVEEQSPTEEVDTAATKKPSKKKKDEKKDLGTLDSLGKKFQSKVGHLAGMVAQEPCQTGRVSVFVNVPVAAGGLVKVSFKFMGQVSRSDDGKAVTMKMTVGGGVTAGKKINLYFATIDAFAAAQIFGYIEAKGSDGEECIRLMCMALHRRLAKVNGKIANAVFGGETVKAALAMMDDDDYVESGLGVEAAIGGGGEMAPDLKGGGWAAGSKAKGERLSMGEDGELVEDEIKASSVNLGMYLPPFRGMGALTFKHKNKQLDSVEGSVSAAAMMSIGDIEGRLLGGSFMLELCSGLGRELHKAKKLNKGEPAEITDEMADYVVARSGAKMAVGAASTRAIKSLKDNYTGLLMGFTLTATISWTKANGYKLTVKLEKTDRFDIGESFRDDLLNVRLENIQRLFTIEV